MSQIIKTDTDKIVESIDALRMAIEFQNRLIEEGVVHFVKELKAMMQTGEET